VPKKPEPGSAVGGTVVRAAAIGKMFDKTPLLASYLVDLQYDDGGGMRQPSRLFVEVVGTEWVFTLKDPTECRQLRVRVGDPGTGLAALEALLSSNTCPWEPDLWAANKPAKKRR